MPPFIYSGRAPSISPHRLALWLNETHTKWVQKTHFNYYLFKRHFLLLCFVCLDPRASISFFTFSVFVCMCNVLHKRDSNYLLSLWINECAMMCFCCAFVVFFFFANCFLSLYYSWSGRALIATKRFCLCATG